MLIGIKIMNSKGYCFRSSKTCCEYQPEKNRIFPGNLSDKGIGDSIYDSYAMRSFMHIAFHEHQVPNATTLLKFRHMLESNKLGEKIFADVNSRLDKAGLMMHGDTIVDARLIAAPKSTKN